MGLLKLQDGKGFSILEDGNVVLGQNGTSNHFFGVTFLGNVLLLL